MESVTSSASCDRQFNRSMYGQLRVLKWGLMKQADVNFIKIKQDLKGFQHI